MNELTQVEKLARAKRRSLYIQWILIAAIGVLLFLVIRGCENAQTEKEAYNQIESILKETIAHDGVVTKEATRLEKENLQLDSALANAIADRDMIQGALIDEADNSKRLSQEVKKAKKEKDTILYYASCDSLTLTVDSLWMILAARDTLEVLLKENIRLRTINLTNRMELFKNAYDSCIRAVKKVDTLLPSIKPRGKFIAVVSGVVSGPILGIGGGFTYKTPRDVLIGAKAYATNQGLFTTLEFGVPLSLKRR